MVILLPRDNLPSLTSLGSTTSSSQATPFRAAIAAPATAPSMPDPGCSSHCSSTSVSAAPPAAPEPRPIRPSLMEPDSARPVSRPADFQTHLQQRHDPLPRASRLHQRSWAGADFRQVLRYRPAHGAATAGVGLACALLQ